MKFAGKWVVLKTIMLNKVTQKQKQKQNMACFLSHVDSVFAL